MDTKSNEIYDEYLKIYFHLHTLRVLSDHHKVTDCVLHGELKSFRGECCFPAENKISVLSIWILQVSNSQSNFKTTRSVSLCADHFWVYDTELKNSPLFGLSSKGYRCCVWLRNRTDPILYWPSRPYTSLRIMYLLYLTTKRLWVPIPSSTLVFPGKRLYLLCACVRVCVCVCVCVCASVSL